MLVNVRVYLPCERGTLSPDFRTVWQRYVTAVPCSRLQRTSGSGCTIYVLCYRLDLLVSTGLRIRLITTMWSWCPMLIFWTCEGLWLTVQVFMSPEDTATDLASLVDSVPGWAENCFYLSFCKRVIRSRVTDTCLPTLIRRRPTYSSAILILYGDWTRAQLFLNTRSIIRHQHYSAELEEIIGCSWPKETIFFKTFLNNMFASSCDDDGKCRKSAALIWHRQPKAEIVSFLRKVQKRAFKISF